MSNATNVMAVSLPADQAGAIVYWRLSGAADLHELAGAWASAGLPMDLLPEGASASRALRRAARGSAGRHRIPRRVGRGSFALVDERGAEHDDLDPEYAVSARIAIDRQTGELQVSTRAGNPAEAAAIRARFEAHLGAFHPRDASGWLSGRVMPWLHAVSLRDAGGVYFVPRARVADWQSVVRAVRCNSAHRLYSVPAVSGAEAVAAVVDSLRAEAEAEVAAVQAELDVGDLGGRALKARRERCSALRDKLSAYGDLLGGAVDDLAARTEALAASVAAAILAAAAADDENNEGRK